MSHVDNKSSILAISPGVDISLVTKYTLTLANETKFKTFYEARHLLTWLIICAIKTKINFISIQVSFFSHQDFTTAQILGTNHASLEKA